MGVLNKILRTGEGRKVKAIQALVPDIGALDAEYRALSDADLQAKTADFRQRIDNGEDLNDLLVEAFAVVREAADRVIGQRHYDVQLMGGAALHLGWVAEMKTGEGKTLVSTLPAYLNALGGKGVHIITVNDYLASFHAEWMGRVHKFLGLDVGLVLPDTWDPAHKRAQYAADITYGTNNEFGFDYLRGNMVMEADHRAQRGFNYAIVDEIDSILIDEARTPLIISGQSSSSSKLYYKFASIVRGLKPEVHYEVDEEKRQIAPTEDGIEAVEKALGVENMYDDPSANHVHQLSQALKAKELFKRDKDYVVQDGEVKIVDEFTGRILEGRRWSEGLHQAVEAKEGVRIKEENQTMATVTLQNYFRLYEKLSGMTGTAQTEAAELNSTYGLHVVPIPTHRDMVRADQPDLIFKSEDAKFDAVVDDISECYERGQPVLVGTISVEKSEKLSRALQREGIPHEVLNAKQHTREAEVVAQAGRLHAITVATNMAGRGVDILLGGNAEILARRDAQSDGLELGTDEFDERVAELVEKYEPDCKAEGDKVRELGGLYVLGTERHDSRRIDNQLRGRSGRQGDPGESRFYLSLDDDLMRLFATGALQWVMGRALPDDEAIEAKSVTKAIERAQNTVEQKNAEIRKNVLKYDEVMNEQRKVIYRRRDQILDQADLRDEAIESLTTAVHGVVAKYCPSDYVEEWDLDGLVLDAAGFWPIAEGTAEHLAKSVSTDELYEHLMGQALTFYEGREVELGEENMRELERQVMLQIIDQHWRGHLLEMDYLQEGIHLRAYGQKDPLVEWQREGFEMFGAMMQLIAEDFVKYIMHAQITVVEEKPEEIDISSFTYTAPEDPSTAGSNIAAAAAAMAAEDSASEGAGPISAPVLEEPEPMVPVVKSEFDKTPRNAPCPCGSGKKFKFCHGAT